MGPCFPVNKKNLHVSHIFKVAKSKGKESLETCFYKTWNSANTA